MADRVSDSEHPDILDNVQDEHNTKGEEAKEGEVLRRIDVEFYLEVPKKISLNEVEDAIEEFLEKKYDRYYMLDITE